MAKKAIAARAVVDKYRSQPAIKKEAAAELVSDVMLEAGNMRNPQYRLFLLEHAIRCTAKPGTCKHVYCPEMKDLAHHIYTCSDSKCQVRYCLRSRVDHKHYRRCDEPEFDCFFCGPVKKAIQDEYWEGTKRKLSFTDIDDEQWCNCTKKCKVVTPTPVCSLQAIDARVTIPSKAI